MTIREIRQERERRHSALFKEVGLFWAFSNQQFEENKTPLADGDVYVSFGSGGFLPKSNVDALGEGLEQINKWYSEQTQATPEKRKELIAYELSNHECYDTSNIESALDALGPDYTEEEVWDVFHEEYPKQDL